MYWQIGFLHSQIIVPVHKEIHWCLAVINKKEHKFQYIDSLKGKDSTVMEVLVCCFFISSDF